MTFRKEKKYKLTLSDLRILKNDLLFKGMKVLYPERKVKSIYFDTIDLRMFHDSDEGILPRKKIRIRNYNNDKIFSKEIKITSEEGRYKKSNIIAKNISTLDDLQNIIDNDYGLLIPTILITYSREYFLYENLRITFDTNIKYINLRSQIKRTFNETESVMEIKTSIDINDDYILKIISMPTSRFSKYCRGIEMLN